jgi:hypothetical protein
MRRMMLLFVVAVILIVAIAAWSVQYAAVAPVRLG